MRSTQFEDKSFLGGVVQCNDTTIQRFPLSLLCFSIFDSRLRAARFVCQLFSQPCFLGSSCSWRSCSWRRSKGESSNLERATAAVQRINSRKNCWCTHGVQEFRVHVSLQFFRAIKALLEVIILLLPCLNTAPTSSRIIHSQVLEEPSTTKRLAVPLPLNRTVSIV
jgi:hypothetical protein